MDTRVLSLGYSGRVLNVTTHIILVPGLRMNGALPLPLPHSFTKLTETTLPIPQICSCSVYVRFGELLHNVSASIAMTFYAAC
jgi:hypothetical protein